MKLKIFIFILGAGLSACSFGKHTFVKSKSIPMDQRLGNSRTVDSIVSPYKVVLDKEMSEVVSYAEVDFINQRPSGNLGNLMADIILAKGQEMLPKEKVICLINFGGLRAPISKGNVTLGDLFKVMPFDNQLVLLKMPASSITQIRDYLLKSGGEPIAGFKIDQQAIYDENGNPWKEADFWVVTSDYLMNGGDKMDFFQQRTETINNGILFRNVIIEYAKAHKILTNRIEDRIKL